MIEEIDFIQPKKIVGQLISIDVLDKIREEIANIYCSRYCENPYTAAAIREKALEIIDKYRAESEE